MLFASLRFSDLKESCGFWLSDSAVCGKSVNQKDKNRALATWSTHDTGIIRDATCVTPAHSFRYKPRKEFQKVEFLYLWHAVDNTRAILGKKATLGVAQAARGRLLIRLGAVHKLNLHSFRYRVHTCANQLQFYRGNGPSLAAGVPEAPCRTFTIGPFARINWPFGIRFSGPFRTGGGPRPRLKFRMNPHPIPPSSQAVRVKEEEWSATSGTSAAESNTSMRLRRPGPVLMT